MSLLCFLLSMFIERETWDTFCMVTLLEDSLYNKYLLSVFYNLAHFLYPLYRFPRAVLYLPYRVLVCVFTLFTSDVSFAFLSFFFSPYQRVFVEFAPGLHCGSFIASSWRFFCCFVFLFFFFLSFVFNVNLWHDFEIKQLQKTNKQQQEV